MGRCRTAAWLPLALLALAGGCAHGGGNAVPCPAPELDTGAWPRVERAGFSFAVPPDARERPAAEADATDGNAEWELPHGGVLGVQHGAAEPPFGAAVSRRPVQQCTEAIGGREARIVVFRERSRIVYAIHWPGGDGQAGAAGPGPPAGLALYALAWHRDDQRRALAAFRTVRFPR